VSIGTELDRRLLRRRTHGSLVSDVSLIASEFLAGFQAIQRIDRPAVTIFGSAEYTAMTDSSNTVTGRAGIRVGF